MDKAPFIKRNWPSTRSDGVQLRLLAYSAAALLAGYSAVTLAPAVRAHTWAVNYSMKQWIGYLVWLAVFGILHIQTQKVLPERDPYLLPIAGILTGMGGLTIWRISPTFGLRQTIWLAVCGALGYLLFKVPNYLSWLRKYKYIWLAIALIMTALTFWVGVFPSGSGPRLWLQFFGVYFQPSEPLKFLLVAYLAAYFADKSPVITGTTVFLVPTFFMTAFSLALLIAQKDLGTTLILIGIYAVMLYLATGRKRTIGISLAAVILAGFIGYFIFDVVRLRVAAWINPWLDPTGRSYQIVQSLIAIASGGIFGTGPGLGSPSLVPIAHSDFIFTSLIEEGGLLFACVLLLVLGLLATRGLRAAICATNRYERYLAAGITLLLIGQSLLIIGGNIRLLPLTGVTLPFVSYGGSSLMVSMICLFMLLSISHHPDEDPAVVADPTPYRNVLAGIFCILVVCALLTGWWTVIRRDNLVERSDNPRRSIQDRYVLRGSILDRSGQPIIHSEGIPGSLTRITDYPPLAPIVGYTDPVYGQSSLESSYDLYLRGMKGYPFFVVLLNQLLTNQPPRGLNVRTTLNLETQKDVDAALGDRNGAAVVVDANSGEILAMASHPGFDPAELSNQWSNLISDPDKPLLNRAAAGLYPPGQAIGAFLLAGSQSYPSIGDSINGYAQSLTNADCALSLPDLPAVPELIQSGCREISSYIGQKMGEQAVYNLIQSLGFFSTPDLPIVTAEVSQPAHLTDLASAVAGQGELQVSPLQMALAAATLSNHGLQPQAKLVNAVKTPEGDWRVLSQTSSSIRAFPSSNAESTAEQLALPGMQAWGIVGTAQSGTDSTATWFIGGSLPQWTGTPFSFSFLLEADDPIGAYEAGLQIIQSLENIK